MNEPRVSVIVLCGASSSAALSGAVQSVLDQTCSGIELLIVADPDRAASARATLADIDRRDAERVALDVVEVEADGAVDRATLLAAGLQRATAPLLIFVPAESRLAPACLEAQLTLIKSSPSLAAVLVRAEPSDPEGKAIERLVPGWGSAPAPPRGRADLLLDLLGGWTPAHTAALLRRESVDAVGGLDPGFTHEPEYDLWLRLLTRCEVAELTDALVRIPDGAHVDAREDLRRRHDRAQALGRLRDDAARDEVIEIARAAAAVPSSPCTAVGRLDPKQTVPRATRGDAALACGRALLASGLSGAAEIAGAFLDEARSAGGAVASADASDLVVAIEVASLHRGGLETVAADLALGLIDHGIRPLVLCPGPTGDEAERVRRGGVEVVAITPGSSVAEIASLLAARGVSVLSAHFSTVAMRAAASLGNAIVVTLHNEYAWIEPGADGELRSLDSMVHRYVAVSASVADFCRRRFAIAPARMALIHNALAREARARPRLARAESRAELGIAPNDEIVLQVGRIDPVKRQLATVDALAELAPTRPHLKVWIAGGAGDRAYAEKVEERVRERDLGSRIVFAGERNDVPMLLAAADVFALPSLIEGMSLAAIEAACAGVPAVLTRTGDAELLVGSSSPARRRRGPALSDARAAAGCVFERPRMDVAITPDQFHALAMRDDPAEGRALAHALAEVLDDLPVRREAAERRARALGSYLAPARMAREYAELLRRAATQVGAISSRRS